jgi:hypothetical protein
MPRLGPTRRRREVAVIAAQRVPEGCRRQGGGSAKCQFTVLEAPHLFGRVARRGAAICA